MINRTEILLVSGAISNSLEKYKPMKLEGNPLVLTQDDKLRRFWRCDLGTVIQTIKRVFRNKPTLTTPLLEQLYKSVSHQGESTLSTVNLQKYLHIDNREPIIVFWNGTTDLTIIKRLRLRGILAILNITAYSDRNNDEFNLKLTNIETKETLYSGYIGKLNKNGRMLNLIEAHGLVCNTNHHITHFHDPIADVILTKCVFDYVVAKIRPIYLYRLAFHKEPEPQYNYDNYVFDLKRIMQETQKIARKNLIQKKEANKEYYDRTMNAIDLHVGDKVLIKEQNKKNALSLNWLGPFEVLVKQHIFIKELSTVIGFQQHNLNALYHDEIPSCLICHIDTANNMTNTVSVVKHEVFFF
ncbi:uncharacterized protein LOC132942283 [Metopolophium dirhodum]|uniref:uncharacterized protein LOC132942283 n=1 Tax=Metopolophium dirhodum TaxID=44670 RepID=UPI00298F6912|nr:uncharacterized protein LOC132942283 [Metopolophium dirhodum]